MQGRSGPMGSTHCAPGAIPGPRSIFLEESDLPDDPGRRSSLELADQPSRRGIVRADLAALQLGQDAACQALAELHAPLVEAVDLPKHALDEGLVLVERQKGAQAPCVQPVQ